MRRRRRGGEEEKGVTTQSTPRRRGGRFAVCQCVFFLSHSHARINDVGEFTRCQLRSPFCPCRGHRDLHQFVHRTCLGELLHLSSSVTRVVGTEAAIRTTPSSWSAWTSCARTRDSLRTLTVGLLKECL